MARVRDMTIEHRDIKGTDSMYQVTLDGRVWSKYSNKYLKYSMHHKGYLKVRVYSRNNSPFFIHLLVAQTYLLNPENKPQVNHKDHNLEELPRMYKGCLWNAG